MHSYVSMHSCTYMCGAVMMFSGEGIPTCVYVLHIRPSMCMCRTYVAKTYFMYEYMHVRLACIADAKFTYMCTSCVRMFHTWQVKAALNQQAQSLNDDAARVKSTEKLLKKITRHLERARLESQSRRPVDPAYPFPVPFLDGSEDSSRLGDNGDGFSDSALSSER